MKTGSVKKSRGLRAEYDLSRLKGGVRGKYYQEASAGTNLVMIDAELAEVFPDTESVNRALRLLVDTAGKATAPAVQKRTPNKPVQTDRATRGG